MWASQIKMTPILGGGVLSVYNLVIRNSLNTYRSEKYFDKRKGSLYQYTFVSYAP
jgi:hypothetical protein